MNFTQQTLYPADHRLLLSTGQSVEVVSEALLMSGQVTATAFPSSIKLLVKEDQVGGAGPAFHELTLAGPMSCTCRGMALKIIFSMAFPGTEVRPTGL